MASPVWWIKDFIYGYKDGYEVGVLETKYTGIYLYGAWEYWQETSFFFQQGYEEGFKKGIEDNV